MNVRAQVLLDWYAVHARDLPWRHTQDAYRIWISEIMLQQTQVKTVLPRFQTWFEKFPNINTLAAASLDDVLKA
ncbi:MAG: A/G-specific adenine glycosylase, partial [Mariprofundaceae bacterium]|nr:A/G-specific adenine glycosylase [Mariprofundaceae bacterium]